MTDQDTLDSWIHDLYGKHPASFQSGAGGAAPGQDSLGMPVPPVPDDLLRRKGDNGVLWQPAPMQTWGVGAPKPAPAWWITAQFDFYVLGPADTPDPSGQGCVFNGQPTTLAALLDVLDHQATLSGYALSRGAAQSAAVAVLSVRNKAVMAGSQLAAQPIGPDTCKALEALDMQSMLDALQAMRQKGQIDAVAKLAGGDRLVAAILSVRQQLGETWEATMTKLTDADQKVIEAYVGGRVMAGDKRTVSPLANDEGKTQPNDAVDDAEWTRKFLKLHKMKLDFSDTKGKRAVLDGQSQTVEDIIDTVCDQAVAAGRPDIERKTVRGVVKGIADSWAMDMMLSQAMKTQARMSGAIAFSFHPDTRVSEAASLGVSGGMIHTTEHTDRTSKDNATVQLSGQVTLEIHPENGSGLEISWVAQITAFKGDDAGSTQFTLSALSGPQFTWVQSFFGGLLKVEPLVQLLGGVVNSQNPANDRMRLVQQGQFAAGGQLVFTVPGTNGHLSFGVQATAGYTGTGGQDTTFDRGMISFAQWNS